MIETSLDNENGDVSAFMESLDHPFKPGIEAIRYTLLALDPGITEGIKWKAPSFGFGNDRVTFNLRHPGRIQIILHRGAKVKDSTGFTFADTTGLIAWAAADRGVVTFTNIEQVDTHLNDLAPVLLDWMRVTS